MLQCLQSETGVTMRCERHWRCIRALILLIQTLALYKSFTYLLTYLVHFWFRYRDSIAILDTWNGIVIVTPISGITQHYLEVNSADLELSLLLSVDLLSSVDVSATTTPFVVLACSAYRIHNIRTSQSMQKKISGLNAKCKHKKLLMYIAHHEQQTMQENILLHSAINQMKHKIWTIKQKFNSTIELGI